MPEENMTLWNAVRTPPEQAMRRITGGRLSGMTDINPQWRYQVMTEHLGQCGIGWKWELVRLWTEPGSEGQVLAFAEIKMYTADGGKWSGAIPGVGGSMLVTKEKESLHSSDEAYKMAITDALSVAMKMLGVGADVYAGLYDSNKYNVQKSTPPPSPGPGSKGTAGKATTTAPEKEHFCEEHDCYFRRFEKGSEHWYSHKIDGGGWCNEAKAINIIKQEKESLDMLSKMPQDIENFLPGEEGGQADEVPPTDVVAGNTPPEGTEVVIDTALLKKLIEETMWNFKNWLKEKFDITTSEGATLKRVIPMLNNAQKQIVLDEMKRRS